MKKQIRKVLVVNAGSSSLKYQLFDMKSEERLAKGIVERIGAGGPANHAEALKKVVEDLGNPSDIDAIGHRVLHGAEVFKDSALMNKTNMAKVKKLVKFGPLHMPPNLGGIEACEKIFPGVPNVGVFDTAFHQTMPDCAAMYAIDPKFYKKYGIRKYGFHGTSHKFVTHRMAEVLGKPLDEMNIITCHLGNGSSITAVKGGKCFDTSMGMTPLAGVMMGTRSGDIDPAVVLYLLKNGFTADEIDAMMNKKGGVLALGGTGSSDMRDLCTACDEGNEQAQVALARLVHSYAMYIGGYTALLGRVDAIVLTGGIGENSKETRAALFSAITGLGITLNAEANNATRGIEKIISGDDSAIPVYVIPTNEELMIARETYAVINQ